MPVVCITPEMSTGSSVSKRASGTSRARLPLMTRSPLLESEADRLLAQTCSRLSKLSTASPVPKGWLGVKGSGYKVVHSHGGAHMREAGGILDDIQDRMEVINEKEQQDMDDNHDFYVKLRECECRDLVLDGFIEILEHYKNSIEPVVDLSPITEGLVDMLGKVDEELDSIMESHGRERDDFRFPRDKKNERRSRHPKYSTGPSESGGSDQASAHSTLPESGGGTPRASSSTAGHGGPSGTEPQAVTGRKKRHDSNLPDY